MAKAGASARVPGSRAANPQPMLPPMAVPRSVGALVAVLLALFALPAAVSATRPGTPVTIHG